jgi:hypothetical protein
MSNLKTNNLMSSPLIQGLAAAFSVTEHEFASRGLPRGTVRGTISSVDDPEERGRVKVYFDDMNPDVPQIAGGGEEFGGEREGERDESDWIDTAPAFKGKQPPGLVGKRVNIAVSHGQYQYAILNDVLFDPQVLAPEPSSKLEMPNNSSMVRLPVYPSGELPPASRENHGCIVIEEGGPMSSDWLCVCLKRNSNYIWVRHVDLQHGHAGENDGEQPRDSANDVEQPVQEQSVWDYVFPTSAQEMPKNSRYGTGPRSNPFGDGAKWNPPPN